MTPDHGEDFDLLLQHTDVAMYVAKKDSLGVVTYASDLDSHSPERLALLGGLRRAVDEPAQIVVHYQPKANLRTGEVTGVEALVRWNHPVQGLLPPNHFIPLAERTGIIRPLAWTILRKALEQNRRWADQGLQLRVPSTSRLVPCSTRVSPRASCGCSTRPAFRLTGWSWS